MQLETEKYEFKHNFDGEISWKSSKRGGEETVTEINCEHGEWKEIKQLFCCPVFSNVEV
jgi:hypothetical protein